MCKNILSSLQEFEFASFLDEKTSIIIGSFMIQIFWYSNISRFEILVLIKINITVTSREYIIEYVIYVKGYIEKLITYKEFDMKQKILLWNEFQTKKIKGFQVFLLTNLWACHFQTFVGKFNTEKNTDLFLSNLFFIHLRQTKKFGNEKSIYNIMQTKELC